jgi:hypothetical protein
MWMLNQTKHVPLTTTTKKEYNVWYDRFMGDQWRQFDDKELSHTRCDMVKVSASTLHS